MPGLASAGRSVGAARGWESAILMSVERTNASHIDLINTVIDKGIVIDAWVRSSLPGIDLVTMKARVIVASNETHLEHAAAIPAASPSGRPFTRP